MGAGAGTARNQLPADADAAAGVGTGAAPSQGGPVDERSLEGDYEQLSIPQLCDLLLSLSVDIEHAAPHQASVARFWQEIQGVRPRGLERVAGPQDLMHWPVVEVLRWLERLGSIDEEVADRSELQRLLKLHACRLPADVLVCESAQETFLRQIAGHVSLVKAATQNLMRHTAGQMAEIDKKRSQESAQRPGQASFRVIHSFRSADALQQASAGGLVQESSVQKLMDINAGEFVELLYEDTSGWAWCSARGGQQHGWVPLGSLTEMASVVRESELGGAAVPTKLREREQVEVVKRHYSGWTLCRAAVNGQPVEGWVADECLAGDPVRAATKKHRVLYEGLAGLAETANGIEASFQRREARQQGEELHPQDTLDALHERVVRLIDEYRNICAAVQTQVSGITSNMVPNVEEAGPSPAPPSEHSKEPFSRGGSKEGGGQRLPPLMENAKQLGLPSWVTVGKRCYWNSSSQRKQMKVSIARICLPRRQVLITFVADPTARKVVSFDKFADPATCPLTKHRKRRKRDGPGDEIAKDLKGVFEDLAPPGFGRDDSSSSSSGSDSDSDSDSSSSSSSSQAGRRKPDAEARASAAERQLTAGFGTSSVELGPEAGGAAAAAGAVAQDANALAAELGCNDEDDQSTVASEAGDAGHATAESDSTEDGLHSSTSPAGARRGAGAAKRSEEEEAAAAKEQKAKLLQSACRAFSARCHLQCLHEEREQRRRTAAALALQAAVRRRAAQQELVAAAAEAKRNAAALTVQAAARRYLVVADVAMLAEAAAERARMRAAAEELTAAVAAAEAAARERAEREAAAKVLQAAARRHGAVRLMVRLAEEDAEERARRYAAIKLIQASAKRRFAWQELFVAERHAAAQLLKAAARRHSAVRAVKEAEREAWERARRLEAGCRIKAVARVYRAKAAILIAAEEARRHKERRDAATLIQAAAHRHLAIRQVAVAARHRQGSLALEALVRVHARRAAVAALAARAREYAERRAAARDIKAAMRRHRAVAHVDVARAAARQRAARVAQRAFRAFFERRRRQQAATKLQAAWRGHGGRRQVGALRKRRDMCATVIQRIRRGVVARRMAAIARRHREAERASARVQASWRGFTARRRAKVLKAAARIRRRVKCLLAKLLLKRLRREKWERWAATRVQASFRCYLQRRAFVVRRGEAATAFLAQALPGEGPVQGPGEAGSKEREEWLARIRQNSKWKMKQDEQGDEQLFKRRRRGSNGDEDPAAAAAAAAVLDRGLVALAVARAQQRRRECLTLLCRAGSTNELDTELGVCLAAREGLLARLAAPEAASEVASIAGFAWSIVASRCGVAPPSEGVQVAVGALARRVSNEAELVRFSRPAGRKGSEPGQIAIISEEDFRKALLRGDERVRELLGTGLAAVCEELAAARKEADAAVDAALAELAHVESEVNELQEHCDAKADTAAEKLRVRRESHRAQQRSLHEIAILAQVEKENLESVLLDRKPRPRFLEQITNNVKALQEKLKDLEVSGRSNRTEHGIVGHSLRTLEGRLAKAASGTGKSGVKKDSDDMPKSAKESERVEQLRAKGEQDEENFKKNFEAELQALRDRRERRAKRKVAALGAKLRVELDLRGEESQQALQRLQEKWALARDLACRFDGSLSLARCCAALAAVEEWMREHCSAGYAALPGLSAIKKHLRKLQPVDDEEGGQEEGTERRAQQDRPPPPDASLLPSFDGLDELQRKLVGALETVGEMRRQYPDPEGGQEEAEADSSDEEKENSDGEGEGGSPGTSPKATVATPKAAPSPKGASSPKLASSSPKAERPPKADAPPKPEKALAEEGQDEAAPPPPPPPGRPRPQDIATTNSPRAGGPASPANETKGAKKAGMSTAKPPAARSTPGLARSASAAAVGSKKPPVPSQPSAAAAGPGAKGAPPPPAGAPAAVTAGAGSRAVRELRAAAAAAGGGAGGGGKQPQIQQSQSAPALDAALPRGAGIRAVQQARKQAQN